MKRPLTISGLDLVTEEELSKLLDDDINSISELDLIPCPEETNDVWDPEARGDELPDW